LTKLHEEVLRGTAGEVLESLAERVRGEVVLVLGPAGAGLRGVRSPGVAQQEAALEREVGSPTTAAGGARATGTDDLLAAIELLLARGFHTKEASTLVSRLAGIDARRAYALAQEAKHRPAAEPRDPLLE
jgi:16S rRNA C1402 (ribose-2'-O) methylase RsmI